MSAPRRTVRWFLNFIQGLLQRFLLIILASGPLPKHVAFIMDGNRRYAGMKGQKPYEGHYDGFAALHHILEVCLRLGIRCVSVYAFALDNFKRSPIEVSTLMDLCEKKLYQLCEHEELLHKYGVRLQVLGRTELLPQHVKDAIKKAEAITRHHDKAILNVFMPYGAQDEIKSAVQSTIQQSFNDEITAGSITESDIDANLYTSLADSPPLDILIRTSGVKRLSDFMLWQCCEDTQIQFTSAYWPMFGLYEFIPMLLDYQRKVWSRGIILS